MWHGARARRRSRLGLTLIGMLIVATGLPSCSGSGGDPGSDAVDAGLFYDCTTEPRAVAAVPGLLRVSSTGIMQATLESLTPNSLVKGPNSWTVGLSDAAGATLAGATIKAVPFMPDHGHGTSVKAVVTDLGAGVYGLTPLNLYMAGYWEVTLTVTPASGGSDSIVFPVCIPG